MTKRIDLNGKGYETEQPLLGKGTFIAYDLNLAWHKEWRKQVVDAFVECRDIDMGEHVEIPLEDWDRLQKALMQAPSRTLPFIETAEQITRGSFALAKHQPCGCVRCTCENENQCQGCGARYCGIHRNGRSYGINYER